MERAPVDARGGRAGKKKGEEERWSAEERDVVLVRLMSKERIVELLKESMAMHKEKARQECHETAHIEKSEENEENEKSEESEEIEERSMAFSRPLPPRSNLSPTPFKPSFLHSPNSYLYIPSLSLA